MRAVSGKAIVHSIAIHPCGGNEPWLEGDSQGSGSKGGLMGPADYEVPCAVVWHLCFGPGAQTPVAPSRLQSALLSRECPTLLALVASFDFVDRQTRASESDRHDAEMGPCAERPKIG
jgi:hypothetical protein